MLYTRLKALVLSVLFIVTNLTCFISETTYAGWFYDSKTKDWFYYETITYDKNENIPAVKLDDNDENIVTEMRLKKGWHKDKDGFTYYLDPDDGHMYSGFQTIGDVEYLFIPDRNQGNYFDISENSDEQSWIYRPNGLLSYGSLLIDKDKKKHPKRYIKRYKPKVSNITEDITESITEDITENISENIAESITEDITENISENITESITKNIAEDISANTIKVSSPDYDNVSDKVEHSDNLHNLHDPHDDQAITDNDVDDANNINEADTREEHFKNVVFDKNEGDDIDDDDSEFIKDHVDNDLIDDYEEVSTDDDVSVFTKDNVDNDSVDLYEEASTDDDVSEFTNDNVDNDLVDLYEEASTDDDVSEIHNFIIDDAEDEIIFLIIVSDSELTNEAETDIEIEDATETERDIEFETTENTAATSSVLSEDDSSVSSVATASEITAESNIATTSEIATESNIATTSEIATESVIASMSEITENETDDHIHCHATDEHTHCIATDSWDEILKHPENYYDCIDAECTTLLYMTGSEIYIPTEKDSIDGSIYTKPNIYTSISNGIFNEAETVNYPIYVSLLEISDGSMTFAQAYVLDELSEIAISPSVTSGGGDALSITNTDGITETWLYHFLNQGSSEDLPYDTYGVTLANADGGYTDYMMHLPGYHISYFDDENDAYIELDLDSQNKIYSRGYEPETRELNIEDYWEYYLTGEIDYEDMDEVFAERNFSLWLPSEQEINEIDAPDSDDMETQTLSDQISTHILEETYIEKAASTWRSDEAYWLRSLPSAYHSDEQYETIGMGDTVVSDEDTANALRMEYFATNEGPAHWTEKHAVRLFFTINT